MAYGLKVETANGILQIDSTSSDDYLNVLEGGTASAFRLNPENDLAFVVPPTPTSGTSQFYAFKDSAAHKVFGYVTVVSVGSTLSLTVPSGRDYQSGDNFTVTGITTTGSNGVMEGTFSSYSGTTLQISVTSSSGSGNMYQPLLRMVNGPIPHSLVYWSGSNIGDPVTVDYIIVGPNKNGTTDTSQSYGMQFLDAASNITFDSRKFSLNYNLEAAERFAIDTLSGAGVEEERNNPTTSQPYGPSRIGNLGIYVNMNNWSIYGTPTGGVTSGRGVEVANGYTNSSSVSKTGIYFVDKAAGAFSFNYAPNKMNIITGETFST